MSVLLRRRGIAAQAQSAIDVVPEPMQVVHATVDVVMPRALPEGHLVQHAAIDVVMYEED